MPITRRSRVLRLVAAIILQTCIAAAWAQPDPTTVPAYKDRDSMEARVQGCVTCHGQQGQGTSSDYFPRIAGKPAGYLLNQLRAFRDGSRRYAPMNYLVAYLSDDYLRQIADYFAGLRPPFPAQQASALPATLMDHGRTLVQNGDTNRQIPPCMSCHGPRLTGMVPGIPGLVGLRPNYIAAQLTRWRAGERRAQAPDCMHRIASRLEETDIQAIAAYLGSVPPPSQPAPDPSNAQRMPLACGSQR